MFAGRIKELMRSLARALESGCEYVVVAQCAGEGTFSGADSTTIELVDGEIGTSSVNVVCGAVDEDSEGKDLIPVVVIWPVS